MAGDAGPDSPKGGRPGSPAQWWTRIGAEAARAIDEARRLWARRSSARDASGYTSGSVDATRPLRTERTSRVPDALHDDIASGSPFNPLKASWADPSRRLWLIAGGASVLLILVLIAAGPGLSRRYARGGTGAAQATPTVQNAPPAEAPADAPVAAPPGQPAAAVPPAAPAAPAGQASSTALALASLPLLLGLFWLLSAWLVDAEARRAFVVQEPWGERRTVAYSCLAVGCVFPLILAGLIFAAWGFVQFVLYVADRQSWAAGIQAGALILLVCASFLLLRSAVARWYAERKVRQF